LFFNIMRLLDSVDLFRYHKTNAHPPRLNKAEACDGGQGGSMKRSVLSLFILVFLITFSSTSSASITPPNLEGRVNLAKAVFYGKLESASLTVGDVGRKMTDYVILVEKIVNDVKEIQEGEPFGFKAYGAPDLIVGESYLFFLRQYEEGIWGFVGGPRRMLRAVKDEDGKVLLQDDEENRFLMRNMEIVGGKMKDLELPAASEGTRKAMKILRGPIEMDQVLNVIERVDQVRGRTLNRQAGSDKIKDKKEEVIEEAPELVKMANVVKPPLWFSKFVGEAMRVEGAVTDQFEE